MTDESLPDRLPLAAGAGAGVVAYLLGYLVTYVTQSGSVEERLQGYNFIVELLGGEGITVWQAVGWLFYNAHLVSTRFEGGFGGPRSENFIGGDGGATVLLYLVPVVLLLVAGALLARYDGVEEPADGAIAGAAVAAGYFPLALVGRFLFSYDGSVAPDIVTAILLAGLVYPLVLGAVGGVAGAAFGGD